MQNREIIDYESRDTTPFGSSLTLITICLTLTLITSFIPLLFRFSSICALPGCLGWLMLVSGLYHLRKMRKWVLIYILVGLILIFLELLFYVTGIAEVFWRYSAVARLRIHDILTIVAFILSAFSIFVTILRLRWMKRQHRIN